MKKVLGSLLVFVFAFTSLVAQGGSSPANAVAAPTGFSINCTSQSLFDTSLVAITWPSGTSRVVTAVIDDTFVITNSGSSDCAFSSGTGLDTDSVAIANGTPRTVTVANSGSFTITPDSGAATTFFVDACSLPGSGISTDPWLVATLADFVKVGEESTTAGQTSCSLSGSYLQTANIANVDTDVSGTRVSGGVFTGIYDGDHYNIAFYSGGATAVFEGRDPLFSTLGPGGVIRRLSLSGNIRSDGTESASLVRELYGGTISEVRSSVLIQVDDDNDAVIGGLVARSGGVDQNGLIIYSKFDGRIEWLESISGARQEGPVIGGLVGMAQGTGFTEIRDSYSRATISFNSGGLTPNVGSTHRAAAVFAGGLVGSDGSTEIDEANNDTTTFNSNNRTHVASSLSVIRSYFAGSFANTCVGSAAQCNTDSPSHVFTGGLIGVSEGRNDNGDRMVSSFWLSTSATNSMGGILATVADPLVYGAAQPPDYSGSSPFLPVAAGLSAANLQTLSTFQTSELQTPSNSGLPGGAEILQAESLEATVTNTTRIPSDQDHRWAIEPGNQVGFVATDYRDVANFASRKLFPDPVLAATYRTRGVVETVSNYPRLGRVWEICANENNGFPVLVWEQRDCAGPGGSGDSGGNPGGLSDAEYAEFLRSGLTLADFLARRLAATGTSDAALGLGGLSAVLLGLVGAALVLIARRQVSRKPR